jgi:hypothetical protein
MAESMLTQSEQTNTATAADTKPVTGAPEQGQQQKAEGQNPKGDTNSTSDQQKGDSTAKAQADAAPYEVKTPEGVDFDADVLKSYTDIANKLKLPQEAAQKMLEQIAPRMKERAEQQMKEVQDQWLDASKSDKEFGGDKLNENLSVAKKALDQFGTPALRALLDESGLGNHPEIIRAFFKAGKAISEDSIVTASKQGVKSDSPMTFNDLAETLYPSKK